jgi:hypothetical protein
MGEELYAYTASPELAQAWAENEEQRSAFIRVVVQEWDREHPDATIAWVPDPGGADQHPVGFMDGGGPVPDGLSRAQGRRYLRPKQGRTGDVYREALQRMKDLPSRTAVFSRFDVPTRVMGGPGDRLGSIRYVMTQAAVLDGTLWVINRGGPLASLHLEARKLSEFHAARERQQEIEAAEKASAG